MMFLPGFHGILSAQCLPDVELLIKNAVAVGLERLKLLFGGIGVLFGDPIAVNHEDERHRHDTQQPNDSDSFIHCL
jgi:hypothetical protein